LRARKDVPLFYVDSEHAGRFIRELNGKRETDRLFELIDRIE